MLSVALFVVPLGVPLPHAHSLLGAGKQADLTNPEATQDAWPDCKTPDAKNNFYTDCTVTYDPKYEHRMAVVGSSETSGVGCPTKSCTWPAKLQDEIGTHGVQVVNLAAGATTITSVEHGGPSEIGYTYRPMYKALKTGEWDAVVFLFGGNDLKKDFWNKTNLATCKNGMDIDGCGFAQDYLKVIKEAQAAGRNGKKAEVFLFAPPTPGCCQLGARYVGSSASGCEYCKACASTQFASKYIEVDPDVRETVLPYVIKKVAEEAGAHFYDMSQSSSLATCSAAVNTIGYTSTCKEDTGDPLTPDSDTDKTCKTGKHCHATEEENKKIAHIVMEQLDNVMARKLAAK